MISEQQSRAMSLKQQTDRVHSMSDHELSQLRADIKVLVVVVVVVVVVVIIVMVVLEHEISHLC